MSDIDDAIKNIPRFNKGDPLTKHNLVYDSSSDQLEPLYFWILDFMKPMFKSVDKVIDNFASSPGSGHFSELQGKASQMQQEASRVLGTVNTILKGVLNLIYDLKEFEMRLTHYDAANSSDPLKKEAGILSLKQMWMDRVDAQRGIGSINALSSGDLNFVTLRDAFLSAKTLDEVNKLDLNDRVKRILFPRMQEFLEWRKNSEKELRKRFEIEKLYLKSQVDALKLNARWSKPYLKAAQQLSSSSKLSSNPALVTVFNTLIIELALMGVDPVKVEDYVMSKELPRGFEKFKDSKDIKKFNSIVVIEFSFRGIPSKAGQHYVFGGRAEVDFKSYALSSDELAFVRAKLGESDMDAALKLVEGMTDDSLAQIKIDLDKYLSSDAEEKAKAKKEDFNPFTGLFSGLIPEKKEKPKTAKESLDELKKKVDKKDNYVEKYIRSLAEANAKNSCFAIYDVYKKTHGMAAFPYSNTAEPKAPRTELDEIFGFK